MFKIDVIAVSRMKKPAHLELIDEYKKRIHWDLKIHEIESKATNPEKMRLEELEKISKLISPQAYIIVLDERGKSLKSKEFSQKMESLQNSGESRLQFIIGGADGLTDFIRSQAKMLISFGNQTWPHMLVRIMLLEQIYRTQQILANHPYHRE